MSEPADREDVRRRERRRKKALFQLWVLPIGFQICAVWLGDLFIARGFRPDAETALRMIVPASGLFYFAGRWQQVRLSLRDNGAEAPNEAAAVGARLAFFGIFLPDAYRSEHWLLFDAGSTLLVFLLVGGLVSWIGRRRERSISIS